MFSFENSILFAIDKNCEAMDISTLRLIEVFKFLVSFKALDGLIDGSFF